MQVNEIHDIFINEFGDLSAYFKCFELSVEEARVSDEQCIWNPGVYVWWHPKKGVIKVGRHLTNSRKRALEHIEANTAGQIRELAEDAQTRILLFNLIDTDKELKLHWVAALEIYFEHKLNPSIPSKRTG